MTNIVFIGVGGTGGFFGGKIAKLLPRKDLQVFFIARGAHLEAIRRNGLRLDSRDSGNFISHPTLATDQIDQIPSPDICFLCVKQYDLNAVIAKLAPKLKPETILIPLLNGVDIPERIRKITDSGTLIPACVYIGTHILSPGVVEQSGGACKLFLGTPSRQTDLSVLKELLDAAEIRHEWTENCIEEIWTKYLFIAPYGLVTATAGKTIGEVYADPRRAAQVRSIMKEIYRISRKAGIRLPENAVETAFRKAESFPYDTKTSFQRDYEAGKPDERELFGRTILTLAEQYDVPVPETEKIFREL